MLSSGIIDLAIGLAFVFGVTAALSSVFTELIARFLGLRGAYLLGGLRELLDGTGSQTALDDAVSNYDEMKARVEGSVPATAPPAAAAAAAAAAAPAAPAAAAASPAEPATKSATGALLGSPILRSQGMIGQITSRNLTVQPGKRGRPLRMTTGTWKRPWRACRSLPAYISAQSFSAAIIDLLVPNAAGQTTMTEVQNGISELPEWMPTLK